MYRRKGLRRAGQRPAHRRRGPHPHRAGQQQLPELRLVRPGQEDICSEYSESPWFYEVAEIAMILALKDYDACYAALKKTRQVVTVLEAAREDAQLGF